VWLVARRKSMRSPGDGTEGRHRGEGADFRIDLATLGAQIARNRLPKAGIADPVRGPRQDGFIAAGYLVFPLRAGFDPRQAAFDRIVDRLMVAEFKMQKGAIFSAAPIAAEERVAADEIQRPGDRNAVR